MKTCTIISRAIIPVVISFLIALVAVSQTILERLDQLEYVPDRVIVKMREGLPQQEVASLMQSANAQSIQRFGRIGAEVWQLSGISVREAIQLYQNDPRIEYIEPDLIHSLVEPVQRHVDGLRSMNNGVIPDDTFFHLQWALQNTGQAPFYGTEGADIDATRAWSLTTGEDILIAIFDTGIDYNHVDLANNMWEGYGYDFFYNDDDPMDVDGHGTHVAGTLAAVGNNGIGVTGVNWSAKLMAVKVLGDEGWGPTSSIIAGIEYSINQGVKISNHSYGTWEYQQAMFDAFKAARDAGQLVIAAAGNWGDDTDLYPHYPANFNLDNIIAVASTDYNDNLSYFSNFGASSVHLGAPGHQIASTAPGDVYWYMWGTSMAAPHVTGTAGLVYSQNPDLDYAGIKEQILISVDPLPSLAGKTITGGRLNAYYAVAGPGEIPPAAIQDLEINFVGSNSVTLQWTAVGEDEHEGTASAYDIRYSTLGTIDDDNFQEAMPVENPTKPQPAGTIETFTITGLDFNTTYYFAIRVSDRWGNVSDVSNSPSTTTLGIPFISVSPLSLSEELLSGQTSVQSLTITNEGEGTLDFSISMIETGNVQSVRLSSNGSVIDESFIRRVLEANERVANKLNSQISLSKHMQYHKHGQTMNADEIFEMRLQQSNTGGGFIYAVVLDGIGTLLYDFWNILNASWQNFGTTEILIDYSTFHNVEITYEELASSGANVIIITDNWNPYQIYGPFTESEAIAIADYINDGAGLYISGGTFNNGEFYELQHQVTYLAPLVGLNENEYYYWNDGIYGPLYFEVPFHTVLRNIQEPYESGFQWTTVIPSSGNWTDGAITTGTLIAKSLNNQTALVVNGKRVYHSGLPEIAEPAMDSDLQFIYNVLMHTGGISWLAVTPLTGTVFPNESIELDVEFDATNLFGGEYTADILVGSNDPENPTVTVPVTLQVTGTPDIHVSTSIIDFEEIFIGTDKSIQLHVLNQGTDVLEVYSVTIDNDVFNATGDGFSLAPFSSHSIDVHFTPGSVGHYNGELKITSNDPDEGELIIELLGSAVNPPVITVTPSTIDDHLMSGETSEHALMIKNTGESNLVFMISAETVIDLQGSGTRSEQRSILNDRERNVNYIRPQEGAPDHRRGDPVRQGIGSPDEYGYNWIDSNEPGGPVFDWVDISGVGTRIYLSSYSYYEAELPFQFPFYGDLKNNIYISSSGFLTFQEEGAWYPWFDMIPDPYPPNDFIAPFWTYLNPSLGDGAVYYYHDTGLNRFIVQYSNVRRFWDPYEYTFQVHLYANGMILFQYLSMGPESEWASIGIENADGTDGLQVAFNTEYVENNLAVRITSMPKWLSLSSTSGTVPAGEEHAVTVGFNAHGLFGGEYKANITVTSNDPATPQVDIPVNLSVTGIPMISVSTDALRFGNVFAGGSAIQHLAVTNTGTENLAVEKVTSDSEQFLIAAETFTLPPGVSQIVPVTFLPDSVRSYSGTITISSNAHNQEQVTVSLHGNGLPPPVLSVSVDTLVVAISGDKKSNELLQLSNLGLNDLTIDIFAQKNNGIPLLPSRQIRAAILYDNCMNVDDIKTELAIYADFEVVDAIDITNNVPSLAILRNYHTVVTANHCELLSPIALGNRLAEYVDSGGSVVMTVAGYARPYHVRGRFLNEGYIPFEVEENYFGYAWLESHDADHPIMNGVSYVGGYTVLNVKEAEGALRIASLQTDWEGQTALVSIKNAVVGVNMSIDSWGWWGDVPRLLRNAIVYAHRMSGPSWLSVSPDHGIVPPNNTLYVNVLFDATGLDQADYYADLVLFSNDPLRSTVIIPGKFKMAVPVETVENNLPDKFALYQNYPNPFNPVTTIKYDLPQTVHVAIQVYSILGEKVATLVNEEQQPGYYSIEWNGRSDSGKKVASGMYIYTINAGEFKQVNRMMLIK